MATRREPHRTRRRLSIEQIEQRRLLALVAIDVNLYEDTGTGPGAAITTNQIEVGETFYVAIDAKEFHPLKQGLSGVSLDIRWDPAVLKSLDAGRNLSEIVTENLPAFLQGEVREEAGEFENLGGSALRSLDRGRAIGDGVFENFAMLQFEAISESAGMTFEVSAGKSQIVMAPTAVPRDADIEVLSESIQIVSASPDLMADTKVLAAESASHATSNDLVVGVALPDAQEDPEPVTLLEITAGTGSPEPSETSEIAPESIGLNHFESEPIEPAHGMDEAFMVGLPGDEQPRRLDDLADNRLQVTEGQPLSSPTVPLPPLIQVSSGVLGNIQFSSPQSNGTRNAFIRPESIESLQSIVISNVGESPLHIHAIQLGIPGLTLTEGDADAAWGFMLFARQSRTLTLEFDSSLASSSLNADLNAYRNEGIIVVSDAANRANFALSNIAVPTFAADIDLDGRVGATDVTLLDTVFGTRFGDDDYSKTLDPNTDGVVDFGDLGLMNAQFGFVHPELLDVADDEHDADEELNLVIDLIASDILSLTS